MASPEEASSSKSDVVVIGSVQNGSIVMSNSRNRQKTKIVIERENQMKTLKQQFPRVDSMTIHDILSKVKFDMEAAQEELRKVSQRKGGGGVQPVVKVSKPIGNESNSKKCEDDPLAINNKPKITKPQIAVKDLKLISEKVKVKTEPIEEEAIFIKEEPIDEFVDVDELPECYRKVFAFFQNATLEELKFLNSVPDNGQTLAQTIQNLRPFLGWSDLVSKIKANFSTDLCNIAREIFYIQDRIELLLEKSRKISEQVEAALQNTKSVVVQPYSIPPRLRLHPHQIEILNWLMIIHDQGVHGILNYKKGTGRMVQLIAFLALLKERNQANNKVPHLVIVPSNIIESWVNAFKTYCPDLKVFVYHGSKEERAAHRLKYYKGQLYKYEVILTTYTVVVHIADEREVFRSMTVDYIIFDETDAAKNINIQLYDNLIKTKALRKLLITGGTLQGNPLELFSVLSFIMPSKLLDDCLVSESSLQKTVRGNLTDGEFTDFEKKVIEEIKGILRPFILKNMQEDDKPVIEVDLDEPEMVNIKKEKEDDIVEEVDAFVNFTESDEKEKCKETLLVPQKVEIEEESSFPRISVKLTNHNSPKPKRDKRSSAVEETGDPDEWKPEDDPDDSDSDSDFTPEPVRRSTRRRRGRGGSSSRGRGRRRRPRSPQICMESSNDESSLYSSVGKRRKKAQANPSCCETDNSTSVPEETSSLKSVFQPIVIVEQLGESSSLGGETEIEPHMIKTEVEFDFDENQDVEVPVIKAEVTEVDDDQQLLY